MPTLNRSTANLVAGLLAVALTAGLVIRTSSAVFTAQTDNTGNSLKAGTIVLTDDDGGSAVLTMSNIAPGESSQDCIEVTYDGTLDPEQVRVFSTSNFVTADDPARAGTATSMQNQVNITIEQGTGGAFGSCAGFTGTTIVPEVRLSSWDAATNPDPDASTGAGYATGAGTWDPTGPGQRRVYRITLELDESTGNDFQGATLTGINLSWATRSTDSPTIVPETGA